MLDERLKAALGLSEEAVFVGQGHKFQIWEPIAFRRASRDGAGAGRGDLRAEASVRRGAPHDRRRRRHVPVLLDEVLEALAPRAGGALSSTARSAPAAIRARFLDRGAASIALDRDPPPFAGGAALAAAIADGRLRLVEARFGDLDASHAASASNRSTASRSTSASPRCSSTRRRAASRCASTPRSTCAWRARAARRRHPARARTKRRSPTSSFITARSAPRAASRAPSSPTARRRRSSRRWQLAEHDRARRAGAAAANSPIPRPARSRRCASPSTTNSANCCAGSPPPSAAEAGRAARRRDLPFAGGPHRQAVPRPPLGPRRGALRAGCPASRRRRAELSTSPRGQPIVAERAEIAANPRARSAKLRLRPSARRRRRRGSTRSSRR